MPGELGMGLVEGTSYSTCVETDCMTGNVVGYLLSACYAVTSLIHSQPSLTSSHALVFSFVTN